MKEKLILFAIVLLAAATMPADVVTYTCSGSEGSNCSSLIPDREGGTPGVLTSAMTPAICADGFFAGIDHVRLDLIHDYVGDLRVRLIGPSTTVTLLNMPSDSGNCASDDIHADFEPDGETNFPCSALHPASGTEPLAPTAGGWFDGADASGSWTLEITDYANEGIGALEGWGVSAICTTIPTVTVETADGNAVEGAAGDVIAFRVIRSATSNLPLTVSLSFSGSATAADYSTPPASVTIPANQASALVSLTAIADGVVEPQEQVIVTVGVGTDYVVGSPSTASAVILDPPVTVPQLACMPPPPDMIAWWRAAGDAADFLGDHNGTLMGGAGLGAGMVGSAFDFDGVNDYVEVPDAASLDVGELLTVDAWVRLESDAGQFQPIVTKWNDMGGDLRSWALLVEGGYLRFDLSASGGWGGDFVNPKFWAGPSSATVWSVAPLPLNAWTHVAATFDGFTGRVSLYVNGVFDNYGDVEFDSLFDTTAPLMIGAGDCGSDSRDFFNGQIDEVELLDRVLSPAEIAAIANAGDTGKCALYAVRDEACGQPRAIQIGQRVSTEHCFEIISGLGTDVMIRDTIQSEWDILTKSAPPELKITSSSRKVNWYPDSFWDGILIRLKTRDQSKAKPPKYAPNVCGAFYLDSGAVASRSTKGDIAWANRLCVAAVSDLDGGGIWADGLGDEDQDGVGDYEEACILGTNPCSVK